jgi:hypothetical protein
MAFKKPVNTKKAPTAKASTKGKTASTNGKPTKSADWAGATKRAGKLVTEARNAKPGGDFMEPAIADGRYLMQVVGATAQLFPAKKPRPGKKDDKGLPEQAVFTFSLVCKEQGDNHGDKFRKQHRLPIVDKDDERYESAQKSFNILVSDLLSCYPANTLDMSEFVLGDLPDFAEQLKKDKPEIIVGIQNATYENNQGQTVPTVRKYFNGPATAAE